MAIEGTALIAGIIICLGFLAVGSRKRIVACVVGAVVLFMLHFVVSRSQPVFVAPWADSLCFIAGILWGIRRRTRSQPVTRVAASPR